MKKRVAVIGVGSAGVLSLSHLCTWLDNSWEIVSIYNPDKPILGIGESTNGGFVSILERAHHFFLGNQEDMKALDATLKFGSKFVNWRPHSWINPLLDGNSAVHFNNYLFQKFAFERLQRLWPAKFRVLEGDVTEVLNREDRVTVRVNDTEHDFDYVLDCMGFPSDFSNYLVSDCSPVNRCEIVNVPAGEFTYEPYTDHIAHENGWMFGVPLQSRKTYGYMYNDQITSREQAQMDVMKLLGVKEVDNKEYRFRCYYSNQLISGRVCKNGNKALFFEPIIANSIFMYIYTARLFYDFITGATSRDDCNTGFMASSNEVTDVISYYYQGGSIFDTDFWKFAQPAARQRLAGRKRFQDTMRIYANFKSRGILNHAPTYTYVPLNWEYIDTKLGYNYIEPEPQMATASK